MIGKGQPRRFWYRQLAEFMEAYQQALQLAPQPLGTKRNKAGSVAAVVAAYLDSTLHFASRAKGTQTQRRTILERFREQYGDYPVGSMPQKFIAAVLTKKRPHAARNWLPTLRALCHSRSSSNTCARTPRAASSCHQ